MNRGTMLAVALAAILGLQDKPSPAKSDADIAREGAGATDPKKKERREALDAMEGKPAPALDVEKWLVG